MVLLTGVAAVADGLAGTVWRREIPAAEFKLTGCALKPVKTAKNGQAVLLNSDIGFVRNSRGFAEVVLDVPQSGWYEIEVSCGANSRTPLEIWVNDYEKVVLHYATAGCHQLEVRSFRHRLKEGRNVLRLLGPGSARYSAVDFVRAHGPVEAPWVAKDDSAPCVADVAAQIDARYAGKVVTLARDITYLEPPKVEKPFSVAIDRVTPENEVVYYSGTVSPKKDDVTAWVTYRVTGENGASALTKPVRVLVKGLGEERRTFVNPIGPGAGANELSLSVVRGGEMKLDTVVVEALGKGVAAERVCYDGNYPDPTLWKGADGRFYAYATPGSAIDRLPCLVSDDGVVWKSLGRGPFSAELSAAIRKDWRWIWAPDRTTVAGTNLLYVSLVNSDVDSAIGVFKLRGDEPGEAYDLRIITRSKDIGIVDTIDPEVVTDPDTGKVWLFFGSTGRMHRVELSPDGLSVRPGAKYVPVAGRPVTENKTRAKVFEGAYVLRRGGWWYLFVSGGWYDGSTYCLRVGRSRTLEGDFVDREGRPLTEGFGTLLLGTEGDFFGPGHNGDVLTGADGVPRLYYHSHWKQLGAGKRHTRILLARRLEWDDEGWPSLVPDID